MAIACRAVLNGMLNPRTEWVDKEAYDQKARELAGLFLKDSERF